MHTRYSPVRRSPPKYCYLVLPLDLHVLSLPLAFILSQDQTLHCKNLFFKLFTKNNPVNSIQNTNKFFDEIPISRLVVYFIVSKNLTHPQHPSRTTDSFVNGVLQEVTCRSIYLSSQIFCFWDDKDNGSILSSKRIDIIFPPFTEITS